MVLIDVACIACNRKLGTPTRRESLLESFVQQQASVESPYVLQKVDVSRVKGRAKGITCTLPFKNLEATSKSGMLSSLSNAQLIIEDYICDVRNIQHIHVATA